MEVFQSKTIRFLDDKVLLIENRLVKKELPYQEIESISIKKGTDVVRPKVSIVFGLTLIMASFIIFNAGGFDPSEGFNRTIVYGVTIMFLFAFFGGYAIYNSLPIHPVIEITSQGIVKAFNLEEILKNSSLEDFKDFLDRRISTGRISIAL